MAYSKIRIVWMCETETCGMRLESYGQELTYIADEVRTTLKAWANVGRTREPYIERMQVRQATGIQV
jgi:hypothetical protein